MLPAVKLVVAIVHNEDAGALVDALLERDFRATRLHSSGGFLKQSNASVLLGVQEDEVDEVMGIVREACHSRTQTVNPMPPIMEPAFWTSTGVLLAGYAVIIAVFYLIKSMFFRKSAAH